MVVAGLWRYPVKSLRGESLDEAELTELGIAGDRLVHAIRPSGRVYTARTHNFELDGRTALDCYVLEPGRVRVGDEAELLDRRPLPTAEAAAGRVSR